jgi:hypothetical protein
MEYGRKWAGAKADFVRNKIPESLPQAIVDVPTDFNGSATQNQTPQDQKEREVVARKSRSHEARKYRAVRV